MTIYQRSRYENSPVVRTPSTRGTLPTVLRRPPATPQTNTAQVMLAENETLATLAARYLRDPELWWMIADVNPEIAYPDDIPPGTVVRVPM